MGCIAFHACEVSARRGGMLPLLPLTTTKNRVRKNTCTSVSQQKENSLICLKFQHMQRYAEIIYYKSSLPCRNRHVQNLCCYYVITMLHYILTMSRLILTMYWLCTMRYHIVQGMKDIFWSYSKAIWKWHSLWIYMQNLCILYQRFDMAMHLLCI